MPQYLSVLLTAVICWVILLLMRQLAPQLGLVDSPTERKKHTGLIPAIGGLAIYIAVALSAIFFQFDEKAILPFYIASALVLLGATDDRFDLSARVRMPLQLGISYAMIHFCELTITSVGNIIGYGAVSLGGSFSTLFTLLCTVGVINSINMIDGVDGLAGSLLLTTLIPLGFYAHISGNSDLLLLLLNLICGMLVFLYFNSRLFRSRASVFLGDAGSMFMGLVLVWCFIELSQGHEAKLSPVVAGWLFGLPLADTVSVMVRRVVNGQSPFAADRTHLHHKLLDAGFSVNQTVCFMLVLHTCFVITGLTGNIYLAVEPILFLGFVSLVICHFFFSDMAIRFVAKRFFG